MFGWKTNQQQINILRQDVKDNAKSISNIYGRLDEIEKALQISGLIEEIDRKDTVNLPSNDPWYSVSDTTYKVNKVNK
jgi:hypothetical protein